MNLCSLTIRQELSEKLMDMRFKLMMMSNEADHKTPIYSTQNHLRWHIIHELFVHTDQVSAKSNVS